MAVSLWLLLGPPLQRRRRRRRYRLHNQQAQIEVATATSARTAATTRVSWAGSVVGRTGWSSWRVWIVCATAITLRVVVAAASVSAAASTTIGTTKAAAAAAAAATVAPTTAATTTTTTIARLGAAHKPFIPYHYGMNRIHHRTCRPSCLNRAPTCLAFVPISKRPPVSSAAAAPPLRLYTPCSPIPKTTTIQKTAWSRSKWTSSNCYGATRSFWSSTSTSSTSSASNTHVAATVPDGQDDLEEKERHVYRELQSVATLLRHHDALYYDNDDNNSVQPMADHNSVKTANELPQSSLLPPISDAEYDALAQREADLCRLYPHLMEQWRHESGFGTQATRYDGRVGVRIEEDEIVSSAGEDSGNSNSLDATTITTGQSQLPQLQLLRTKRRHGTPMLSLDNVHSTAQLLAWLERVRRKLLQADAINKATDNEEYVRVVEPWSSHITIVTEPKLDGVSLSLRYSKDVLPRQQLDDTSTTATATDVYTLQWASTRGDGQHGTDVTQAVYDMGSIPTSMSTIHNDAVDFVCDAIEVRGEIVVPLSTFRQWQLQGEAEAGDVAEYDASLDDTKDAAATAETETRSVLRQFSNARNAASGILLRKESVSSPVTTVNDNDTDANAATTTTTTAAADSSRELRSQLRFYAYDIIYLQRDATNSSTLIQAEPPFVNEETTSNRNVLQRAGFAVPMPVSTTVLQLDLSNTKAGTAQSNDDGTASENGDIDLAVAVSEADVAKMLQYHKALSAHRDLESAPVTATATKPKSRGKKAPDATSSIVNDDQWTWGDFEMDGCVHKIVGHAVRHVLGNSNRAPRWAVAHKFAPTAVVTELWNVEIQVGRTGSLTPVAVLKPVDIGGVIVQRATMHNFFHMQQMLGGVESIAKRSPVLVRRAGDVIPQVVSRVTVAASAADVLTHDDDRAALEEDFISITLPTQCPACGSPVVSDNKGESKSERSAASVAVGQVLRCSGPPLLCPPRAVAALQHAFARDAFDVTGLSEARIQQLMQAGYLNVPSDVFALAKDQDKLAEIADLDGWGTKSVQNLANVANRVATQGVSLSRFIYSLGIRLSGSRLSAQLAGLYGTVEAFLVDVDEAAARGPSNETFSRLQDETEATKGIGPSLLDALREFASQEALVEAAHQLAKEVRVVPDTSLAQVDQSSSDESIPTASKPLLGMSVVFTGSIAKLSRTDAQNVAKEMGAKYTPSAVSKSTGLVVSGGRGGKKIEQAEKLGVRIVSADEFMQMVESFRSNS